MDNNKCIIRNKGTKIYSESVIKIKNNRRKIKAEDSLTHKTGRTRTVVTVTHVTAGTAIEAWHTMTKTDSSTVVRSTCKQQRAQHSHCSNSVLHPLRILI